MMYAQYCRIESAAGGVTITPRAFVRAAHGFITDSGKDRAKRTPRHAWLRRGLTHLANAQVMYLSVVSGRRVLSAQEIDQREAEAAEVKATLNPLIELYSPKGV